MLAMSRFVKGRYISFCLGCIVVIGILQTLFIKLVEWILLFTVSVPDAHHFPAGISPLYCLFYGNEILV